MLPESIAGYCVQDFERFVQTFGLVQRATGNPKGALNGLELGGTPYFSTMLLRKFTSIDWYLGNYSGDQIPKGEATQRVYIDEFRKPAARRTSI